MNRNLTRAPSESEQAIPVVAIAGDVGVPGQLSCHC